jgi:hypothetical protein
LSCDVRSEFEERWTGCLFLATCPVGRLGNPDLGDSPVAGIGAGPTVAQGEVSPP